MATVKLEVGDTLTFTNKKSYRILIVKEDFLWCCLLNVKSLIFASFSSLKIANDILNNAVVHEKKDNIIIDTSLMSDNEKQQYEKYKKICKLIDSYYGPTYEILSTKKKKPELEQIVTDFNIKKETLRLLYIKYIQSGMDVSAIIDNRYSSISKSTKGNYKYKKRPGRQSDDNFASKVIIDDKVRKQFDEALNERKSGRHKTYESAYNWMVNKFYTETYMENGELFIKHKPESKIPTLRQFVNYARKNTTKKELDVVNTSLREVRNDKRLLLGDSFNDVLGAGDLVEIDAVEVDLSLVSSYDRKQTIGRPIMYLMIDVYTRMILAMSVSLHNNSIVALTNLFLNLCDDKKEFSARYSHYINDDAWISNIVPRRIRVDRGADFASNIFGDMCEELGIDRQLVPAATGSLKGSIEQEFRTLHSAIKPHLDGNGVMTKRHDSDHHKKAVMTVDEFTKMAVDFVLHHNSMCVTEYPYTAEMVAEGIHAVPAELWAYSTKKYGAPRPIVNLDAFRYALMLKEKGSVDRTGITFKGLSYINTQDEKLLTKMYELQNKREKMDIRVDPRSVSEIYYLRDGKLNIARLNPAKTMNIGYEHMTLFELEEFIKKEKQLKKEGEVRNRRLKSSMYSAQEAIVQESKLLTPSGPNNIKNLNEARNFEKQRIAKDNSVASRLLAENNPQLEEYADVTPEIEAPKAQIPEKIVENEIEEKTGLDAFEAAMNIFNSEV